MSQQRKTYTGMITVLGPMDIFVFGSNTEGRHGKGAALVAQQKFGAVYGEPSGLQGNSYGIITKNLKKTTHPSVSEIEIARQIRTLYQTALLQPQLNFYVAYSATSKNLNGYTPQEMAEMFGSFDVPMNIVFEDAFWKLVEVQTNRPDRPYLYSFV